MFLINSQGILEKPKWFLTKEHLLNASALQLLSEITNNQLLHRYYIIKFTTVETYSQ